MEGAFLIEPVYIHQQLLLLALLRRSPSGFRGRYVYMNISITYYEQSLLLTKILPIIRNKYGNLFLGKA
jgi:hypothetical protein